MSDRDQELTPEGCTIEEAAIFAAAGPVEAKCLGSFDYWTFEEGWRCGRDYESAQRAGEPTDETAEAADIMCGLLREMFPHGVPPDDQQADEEAAAVAFVQRSRAALDAASGAA